MGFLFFLAQASLSVTFTCDGTWSRFMRWQILTLSLVCGLLIAQTNAAPAQGPGVAVLFRNDTKSPVIIQGISSVGGMIRRGQPVVIAPNHSGGDFNVPSGSRVYSVYDADHPSRVLAKDVPFHIPAGTNLLISVRSLPNNTVGLVPEAARP